MELLFTENYYIINKNEDSLWFDRRLGTFQAYCNKVSTENTSCLGIIYGIIGKIQILADAAPRLVLVTGVKEVGLIDIDDEVAKQIYCITKVIFLPLTISPPDCELSLDPCHNHHTLNSNSISHDRKNILPFGDFQPKIRLSKTFGTLKNVTSSIKSATANATGQFQNKSQKEVKDKERYERRILDELHKMFNEYESFYFSYDADITNSLQSRNESSYDDKQPLWKRANDNFFWNKQMLSEFIASEEYIPTFWLIPIIQGFIQIENVTLESVSRLKEKGYGSVAAKLSEPNDLEKCYKLIIISRRSRHRAGTRYKRRGVDEKGNVANYVETEQIVSFSHHQISFLQIRGSVPVFWSQPGHKYRPPPRLDRDSNEIALAFEAHFNKEFITYQKVSCISLVEQTGKEKIIADAYLKHVLAFNSPFLTFISFDFHEYCRGMRYENVSVLIEGIEDVITTMSYCWVDKQGFICKQNGVFRINCIDCLDRTNVLQTALGKAVLENQFTKLGILPPEHSLPANCQSILQSMWANNGDIISKQYAGTSALKGDFTRTGQRNITGLMKDGMNSANRYYLNRFKDAYRQATIDTLLCNHISEDLLISLPPDPASSECDEEEDESLAQHVKHVIDDCKKLLVPDAETILGAWGLIDADPINGNADQSDMDIILVLTRDSYYVAQYDEEADSISDFQRVSLIDLSRVEVGPYTFQGLFKQSKTHFCVRFYYQDDKKAGYLHTFRSMNIRFFNNLAVRIKTEEEIFESVRAIADTFEGAAQMIGCDIEVHLGKLNKLKNGKRSSVMNPLHLFSPITSFSKSTPETLKSVGTRAFSNVASGFAKLNPIASIRDRRSYNTTDITNSIPPTVSILKPVTEKMGLDLFVTSCGIIFSYVKSEMVSSPKISSQLPKSTSDSQLHLNYISMFAKHPPTPEINISTNTLHDNISANDNRSHDYLSTTSSVIAARTRKLSHSSEEIDIRQEEGNNLLRASSATELDLQLPLCNDKKGTRGPTYSPLSPLSPLSNINKDTVLAPFSVLARGVQSLVPSSEKLARGVQSIGVNLDPRKLKLQRQEKLDRDLEMKALTLKCKSRIIQL